MQAILPEGFPFHQFNYLIDCFCVFCLFQNTLYSQVVIALTDGADGANTYVMLLYKDHNADLYADHNVAITVTYVYKTIE